MRETGIVRKSGDLRMNWSRDTGDDTGMSNLKDGTFDKRVDYDPDSNVPVLSPAYAVDFEEFREVGDEI